MTFKKFYLKILLGIFICSIVVMITYNYVDQPLANWIGAVFNRTTHESYFRWVLANKALAFCIINLDIFVYYIAVVALIVCFVVPLRMKHSLTYRCCACYSLSVIFAYIFKNILKSIFGRCCTKGFSYNVFLPNSILADKNLLVFHFFKNHPSASLFPSGHMAILCAAATALYFYFPRLKYFWVTIVILTGISLLVTNSHFLSDIIAGAFLGIGVAICTNRMLFD